VSILFLVESVSLKWEFFNKIHKVGCFSGATKYVFCIERIISRLILNQKPDRPFNYCSLIGRFYCIQIEVTVFRIRLQ
ncbi:MAG: hypothetical protein CSA50_08010, partial [Gammaproteobacteria bacterium]